MREAVVENLDLVTFRAHVTITFCDYSERGILGTDPWFAVSRDLGQTWVVQRAEPPAGGFVFRAGDDSSSEPLFTLQEGVNQDIKEFVARKLAMLAYASGADHVVEEAVVPYTGSMFEYTGPCVCEKIRDSSDIHPFDWKGHTGGGRYPDRCFCL